MSYRDRVIEALAELHRKAEADYRALGPENVNERLWGGGRVSAAGKALQLAEELERDPDDDDV